jgi:hypothetical protein
MHNTTHASLEAREPAESPPLATTAKTPQGSLIARLLEGSRHDDVELSLRLGAALGLASVLGLGIGLRMGPAHLVQHALSVPLIFVANLALGVPALGIGLSFFDAEIRPRELLRAAVDAVAAGGIAFAGLAPVCAFFVLTTETLGGASGVALLTLLVGSTISLLRFVTRTFSLVRRKREGSGFSEMLIALVFIGFAVTLSLRIFFTCIPLLDPSVRA